MASLIYFFFVSMVGKIKLLFAIAVIFDDMAATFATVTFVAVFNAS